MATHIPPAKKPDLNRITIRKQDIVMRSCVACGTTTVHLDRKGENCLQCLLDGQQKYQGDTHDYWRFNRWLDKDGKPLPYDPKLNGIQPRGYKSK